jgi:CubicO group peptidase (beta-lactamase class C family)
MQTRRLFSLLSLCALAAAQTQVTPQRLDDQAQGYARLGQFTGTVLVAIDGRTLLSKGYGLGNAEWNIPNTPQTKFRLGSITKQFTAMAVLLLEQQGKLKVADPVCKYVESCPAAWQPVTLHHLLTHTSGIPNFTSFPDYKKTMMIPSPPLETVKRFTAKPLDFDPGSKHSYSNSGYVLLGLVIEKVAGESCSAFLTKNILAPLGMSNTGYDNTSDVLPMRASGYERKGSTLVNAPYLDMTIPHAAGSMYSTTLDLMTWDVALNNHRLLNEENYKRYFTPALSGYAYGWNVAQRDGVEVISHGGGINGFATTILRLPARKLVVVALSNVTPSQVGRLGQDLLKLALGQSVEVPKAPPAVRVPVETLKQYVGVYEISPAFLLTITLEGETLITQATGQGKFAVHPRNETTFSPKEFEAEIVFQRDATGKVTGLVVNQGGGQTPAKKVK